MYTPSVMVLDGGLPTSTGIKLAGCQDFTGSRQTLTGNQHTTLVCNIIGSSDPVLPGVCPEALLFAARVLGGPNAASSVATALDWALELKPDIICCAWAAERVYSDRLLRLLEGGTIIVAAYHPILPWPHSDLACIAADVDSNPRRPDVVRTVGTWVRDIATTPPTIARGSSVSAAYLTGLIAKMRAADPSITRRCVLASLARDGPTQAR